MRALALLYHDVVQAGDWDSSGFPGPAAASYKLERREFERHLAAMSAAVPQRRTVQALASAAANGPPPVLLTFDDGGASAHDCVADLLEARGLIQPELAPVVKGEDVLVRIEDCLGP